MVGGIVIESPTGDRAVVDPEALPQWLLRGFRELGPVAPPGAEGTVTESEWAATLAARVRPVAPGKAKTTTPTKTAEQKG